MAKNQRRAASIWRKDASGLVFSPEVNSLATN
jgi:hypothetical protein